MATSRIAPDKLFALAKEHLGLPPSTPATAVPNFYLTELANHLKSYPYDVHYRVALRPAGGFGSIRCLEQGCNNIKVRLGPRLELPDGGKKDGFGSLTAYQLHIQDHSTHRTYRDIRVKTQEAAKSHAHAVAGSRSSTVTVKPRTTPFLKAIDSDDDELPVSPLFQAPPIASRASLPTRAFNIKREIPASVVPQKRHSSTASFGAGNEEDIMSHSFAHRSSQSKKFKLETPKSPLGLVNTNKLPVKPLPMSSPPLQTVTDARSQLRDIQSRLSVAQTNLDRLQRKPNKSKGDITRMASFTAQVRRLREEKNEVNASIPSVSHVRRPKLEPFPFAPNLPSSPLNHSAPEYQPIDAGSDDLPQKHGDADEDQMVLDSPMNMNVPMDLAKRIAIAIPQIAPLPPSSHHDENGDFYGRGRDTFVGPQAKADDIDKFLIEAGNAEQFDGNASLDKALQKLGLGAQYNLLPGMEVALMPHQTIGVAWMLDREASSFQGGCLGDEMGLGKTVQMIATMVKNQSDDPRCKTNLIIAPTALLDQWKLEIEMKSNGMKCLIYHGSSKPKRRQDIIKYDVVLTTYATMALEWPDFEADAKAKAKAKRKKNRDDGFIESDSEDYRTEKKKKKKELGLLFQIDFFRIILDEAQNIRNKKTRNSRAVTALSAKYRWCLTGTPIINGLQDAYAYVRFLKIRPWYDWDDFNRHVALLEKKNPSLAVTRLQAILSSFMMRRMKTTLLDGKRLIELPEKIITLIKLEFSAEERDIYKMVEARSQATFNRFLRAGTVLKNYHQVLVLLLRLRQICSHPSLIQEGGMAFIGPDEAEDDNVKPELRGELARARQLVSPDFVKEMKDKLKQVALRRIAAEQESVDATVEADECPLCMEACTDAIVTPCGHIFCRECAVDVLNTPQVEDVSDSVKYRANERPCPSCCCAISEDKLFSRHAFEPSGADLSGLREEDVEMADVPAKGKAKARAKRATRRMPDSEVIVIDSDSNEEESEDDDDDDDMSDFIVESDEDEEEKDIRRALKRSRANRRAIVLDSDDEDTPEDAEAIFGARSKAQISQEQIKLMPRFLPSTKMKHMMDTLLSCAKDFPDEKTLIISQWTQNLALVSDYLTEKGILHVKYQGDMNRVKRDQAIRVFMSKDKARVMLMSLKCGGTGLNLTRSNRVISLDLGWSQAIESQAFDRVHRLGQMKTVHVQRLVIADTVEDRVLALQERKQNLADGSLGEGNGKKIGRLSVRELANLFGLDHRGRVLAKD